MRSLPAYLTQPSTFDAKYMTSAFTSAISAGPEAIWNKICDVAEMPFMSANRGDLQVAIGHLSSLMSIMDRHAFSKWVVIARCDEFITHMDVDVLVEFGLFDSAHIDFDIWLSFDVAEIAEMGDRFRRIFVGANAIFSHSYEVRQFVHAHPETAAAIGKHLGPDNIFAVRPIVQAAPQLNSLAGFMWGYPKIAAVFAANITDDDIRDLFRDEFKDNEIEDIVKHIYRTKDQRRAKIALDMKFYRGEVGGYIDLFRLMSTISKSDLTDFSWMFGCDDNQTKFVTAVREIMLGDST